MVYKGNQKWSFGMISNLRKGESRSSKVDILILLLNSTPIFFCLVAEFLVMWNDLKWPGEADLERSLIQLGQTPAQTTSSPVKAVIKDKKKSKKASRQRQAKIQNTHLDIDLTKDYVPPTEPSTKM